MKTYHMELTIDEGQMVVDIVNRAVIDAHLQAVSNDSTFEVADHGVWGKRLVCDVAPNDMRVIIRRLLESDDDTIEMAENLVLVIASTLGIDEIWLCTEDRFYITLDEGYFEDVEEFELLAARLDLPYISVFDDEFWPTLFAEV